MTPPPRPSPPPARRRAVGLGMLAGVGTLAIAIGACEWLEWPFLRHPLETRLSQLLERPVAFGGRFGVRLIGSLRAHADSLVVGPAPQGTPALVDEAGRPRELLRASGVRLALSWSAFHDQWAGTGQPLRIRLLDVDGLELNLKRDADGRANWLFGGASAPRPPQFERLNVRHGEVRVVDVPLQIRIDLHVRTHEGTAATGADAMPQARIATPGATAFAASGGTGAPRRAAFVDADAPGLWVDGTGSYRALPLNLQLRASGLLPLAASDEASPAVPMWLDVRTGRTRIRLDGTATDLLHFGGMDAAFTASGPSLAAVGDALGVTLPTTARFATHGRLRKHGAVWDAGVAALDIGSSRLHGDFRFDTGAAIPKLTGMLVGTRLALADLGPAFGAATPEAPAPARPGRVLPAREFDIPSLKAMNAEVGVRLAVLDLGTASLATLQPLQGRVTLQDGVLDLGDLLARTAAGSVSGQIGLDSRPVPPRWHAELRWSGIQLDRFIKARDKAVRRDADGQRPDTGYLTGALGGNATLTGAGRSTASLLASLDGRARLWVRAGTVSHLLVEAAGIDVAQALGVFAKGDEKLPMQCALAQLDIVDGKVVPDVALIDTRDTTMLVDGDLSLATETLDLRLQAHPHDFSPLALRTPVKVGGTFAAPHIRPEAKALLLRAGAAAALSLAAPPVALLALVDFSQPERDVCTAAVSRVEGAARAGVKSGPATPAKKAALTRRQPPVGARPALRGADTRR